MADIETVVYRLQADVADVKRAFSQFEDQTKRTNREFENLASTLRTRVSGALNLVSGGLLALGIEQGVTGIIRMSDQWRLLQAQMVRAGVEMEKTAGITKSLYDNSQLLGVSFEGTIDTFNRIARSTRDLGIDEQTVLQITESLNSAIAASGATAEDAAGGLYQLGQSFQKGKLNGDELVSISERLPVVMEVLRDYAKKLGLDFQELQNKSQITTKFMVAAFVDAGDRMASEAGNMPNTMDKAMTRTKNSFFAAIGEMTKQGLFDPVIQEMGNLSDIFASPQFQQNVAAITTQIMKLVNFIAQNLDKVQQFGPALATAFAVGRVAGPQAGALAGGIVAGSQLLPYQAAFEAYKKRIDKDGDLLNLNATGDAVIAFYKNIYEQIEKTVTKTDELKDKAIPELVDDAKKANSEIRNFNADAPGPKIAGGSSAPSAADVLASIQSEENKKNLDRLYAAMQKAKQDAADAQKQLESFRKGGESRLRDEQARQSVRVDEKQEAPQNATLGDAKGWAAAAEASAIAAAKYREELDKLKDKQQEAVTLAEQQKKKLEEEQNKRDELKTSVIGELQEKNKLKAALDQGVDVYEKTKIAIEAEKQAIQAGYEPGSAELQQIVDTIIQKAGLTDAIDKEIQKRSELDDLKKEQNEANEEQGQELKDQERLIEALGKGKEEYEKLLVVLEAEKTLRALKIDIMSEEGKKYIEIASKVALNKAEVEKLLAVYSKKETASLFEEAFKTAIQNIQNALSDFFEKTIKDGFESFEELSKGIQDIMIKGVANTTAALLMNPNKIGDFLGQVSQDKKGTAFGTAAGKVSDFFKNEKVSGGIQGTMYGMAGGTAVGTMMGADNAMGQQVGGLVGGAAGAVIGSFVGMPMVGAMIGSALGSIVGGFFGGGGEGENNDAMGFRYEPNKGGEIFGTDESGSPQNESAAKRLIDDFVKANEYLAGLGINTKNDGLTVKVGNKTGIEVEGQRVATGEDAFKLAMKTLLEGATMDVSETTRKILTANKAGNSQELQQQIAFGRQYDNLLGKQSAYMQQLQNLKETYTVAGVEARKYGLDIAALSEAEKKAIEDLKKSVEANLTNQLRGQSGQIRGFFDNIVNPYKQVLSAYGTQAGIVSPEESIKAGLSEFRETFKLVQQDNLEAIQSLPGMGQNLINLVQQYGASGPEGAAIIREILGNLQTVSKAQTDRQAEILMGIKDAINETAGDQIRTLVEGFNKVAEELAQFRRESTA